MRNLVKGKEPLSVNIIKQIHYLVLVDRRADCGVYRRVSARIIGAKHKPVRLYLMSPKMEQLFGKLLKKYRAYHSPACTILY